MAATWDLDASLLRFGAHAEIAVCDATAKDAAHGAVSERVG